MQRVDCQVRLSGKLTHTVGTKNISVAEIAALRAIHSAHAVVDVQPKANDKTPHAAAMDHPRKTYGHKVILALLPPPKQRPDPSRPVSAAVPAPYAPRRQPRTMAAFPLP